MISGPRDLMSVVADVKVWLARLVESYSGSLTSIQQQAALASLNQDLAKDGVSFSASTGDSPEVHVYFSWSFERRQSVSGTGVIADVSVPENGFPFVTLSVGDDVVVIYQPRSTDWFQDHSREISTPELARIKKGDAHEFHGVIDSCTYYFGRTSNPHIKFSVENNDYTRSVLKRIGRNLFR
jgi:hypothetical protein